MRTLSSTAILLAIMGVSPCVTTVSAEPPAFAVPHRTREHAPPSSAPLHDVVLPADVLVRPGETPDQALARALHPERDTPARPSK